MNRILIIVLSLNAFFIAYAQDYGLSKVGYIDITGNHNTQASDIWGWVDGEGNEYAIVGLNNGTSIVSLCNPQAPEEVFFKPGANSIWRDIKTWNNYAYVTTEAKEGLLIIDLSKLPFNTNLTTTYFTPSGTDNGFDLSAHNLFIDEKGFLYLFGSNIGNKGCHIYDLSNPVSPSFVGKVDNFYVHDGVAKNDTLFLAHVNNGFFGIYDASDKSNIKLLGTKTTPNNFSHNIWFSDDLKYVYTTDEKSGGFIAEYDVSDPKDIKETDRIRTTLAKDVIPHNAHFRNNYIITSYYRDGVLIHDVSEKGNMKEVARFDTAPDFSGNGFNGCWGVYPFLPSGLIIASDIEKGLFILETDSSIGITKSYDLTCSLGFEANEDNNIEIYPNPIDNEIILKGQINSNLKLELFNLLGEKVFETNTYNSKIIIPNQIHSGLYIAKVSEDGSVLHTQRLVKK